MKLYEIDGRIMELLDKILFDPETGEIDENYEAVSKEIDDLSMERDKILKYLAEETLNVRAEESALKAEEQRLKNKRTVLENKEARLLKILDRECAGKRKDLGIAVFSYRHSDKLEVSNAAETIHWLAKNGITDGYRVSEPEVNKEYVKKLIKSGREVPGSKVVPNVTYSLR